MVGGRISIKTEIRQPDKFVCEIQFLSSTTINGYKTVWTGTGGCPYSRMKFYFTFLTDEDSVFEPVYMNVRFFISVDSVGFLRNRSEVVVKIF